MALHLTYDKNGIAYELVTWLCGTLALVLLAWNTFWHA